MKKITLYLSLFLATSTIDVVNSQTFQFLKFDNNLRGSIDKSPNWKDINESLVNRLDSIYPHSSKTFIAYKVNKKTFIQVYCGLDTYVVENNILIKQNEGFTVDNFSCENYPLERNNTHYLVVGQGFKNNELDLLQLDQKDKVWRVVPTSNKPQNIGYFTFFQSSTGIFAFPLTFSNAEKEDHKVSAGYFLNWETKEWVNLGLEIEKGHADKFTQAGLSVFFETNRFFITHTSNNGSSKSWNVVEKETGEIYKVQTDKKEFSSSPFLEVSNNTVYFQNALGALDSLNFDNIRESSIKIGKILLPSRKNVNEASLLLGQESKILFSLGLVLLVTFGISLVIFYSKKTSPKPQVNPEQTLQYYINELKRQNGKLISSASLDKILDVYLLENIESQRIKRSRLINEINKKHRDTAGKDLINRSRTSKDRRFISYLITC